MDDVCRHHASSQKVLTVGVYRTGSYHLHRLQKFWGETLAVLVDVLACIIPFVSVD